jgi:hypothetical protein
MPPQDTTTPQSSQTNYAGSRTTHWSVVLAAGQSGGQQAAEALAKFCHTYWYPLYAFVLRQGCGAHDAEELIQGFFAWLRRANICAWLARSAASSVGRS